MKGLVVVRGITTHYYTVTPDEGETHYLLDVTRSFEHGEEIEFVLKNEDGKVIAHEITKDDIEKAMKKAEKMII